MANLSSANSISHSLDSTLTVRAPSFTAAPSACTNLLPLRSISALSDRDLENLEHNYRKSGRVAGGAYSLRDVMTEKSKRVTGGLVGQQVVKLILDLSRESADGFTSYATLWAAIFPSRPWCGNKTVRSIMQIMDVAIRYCADNSLPIVTTLIVRSDTRTQSPGAVENIYNAARAYGVDVGLSADDFVSEQILKCFDLAEVENNTLH